MFIGVDVERREMIPPQLAGHFQCLETRENVQSARAARADVLFQRIGDFLEGMERLRRRHFLHDDTIRADQKHRVRRTQSLGVVALVDDRPRWISLEREFREDFFGDEVRCPVESSGI